MLEVIKKLYKILSKEQKVKIAFLGVMVLIGGVLETLGVSVILPLVTAILDTDALAKNQWVILICDLLGLEDMTQFILFMLITIIIVFAVKNAYLLLLAYVQSKFVNRNQAKTVSYLLEEYLNRPYEFYLNADIPTVFRTIDGDVPKVFTILMELLLLATEVVVSLCLCIFLLIQDPQMTFVIAGIMFGMTIIIMKILKPKLHKMGREAQTLQSRMGKWRLQSIYGIKDVKVLNKEDYFAESFDKYAAMNAKLTSRYAVLNNAPRLLIETVSIAGVLLYMAISIINGNELTSLVSSITAFAVAAIRLLPSVNRINTHITNIAFFEPSLNYVYENVDFSDYQMYGKYQGKHKSNGGDLEAIGDIKLENITYAYPNTEKKILNQANMVFPIGKSIGVMGPSGSGKTTAIDILLGLLEIQEGKITCNGQDIFENYGTWLSHIGYIPQAIFLTDDSIRENIAFGVSKDNMNEERIWEVLEEAQLKTFVEQLPDGLDTTIGERGVRISGGQRQRLGIARALYHNPEILVFDEATSALDNDTETAIMEAIDSFHGKKTLIIIAHRLRTIENCDIIYKIEEGQATINQ